MRLAGGSDEHMKVLVTGGAGYIGSHANRVLARQGVETVVLDDLSNGHREAVTEGRLVVGDMGDRALLDELMTAEKFDAIMDFAAFIEVGESVENPAKYYENNVVKLKTLLDAAVAHKIRYFVFRRRRRSSASPVMCRLMRRTRRNQSILTV